MILFEIIAVIVVLAFVANGVKAGSIETLGRALGAVVGFLAARACSGWLIGAVSLFLPGDWAYALSFLVIFLAVDYLVGMVFALIENILKIFTRLPVLKQINGVLGGAFGLLEAVVVVGGVAWIVKHALTNGGAEIITSLKTVSFINGVFESLFRILL
jgi:uncharacterized membrane protein required for colicin V production